MTSCDKSFERLLSDLHNSCSLSNIVYLLAGVFGVVTLPGWWRLLGVAALIEAVVSFINHGNMEVGGISSTAWNYTDVGFAVTGCIGVLVLVILKRHKLSKRNVFICAAVFVTALFFFVVSVVQAKGLKQSGQSRDPVKTFGLGDPLAEERIATNYDDERHQALYLSYHTSWHIVSGMTILVMFVVLAPTL